jgi:hypothetical protein
MNHCKNYKIYYAKLQVPKKIGGKKKTKIMTHVMFEHVKQLQSL